MHDTMKIAIIGYGRMGKAVETMGLAQGHRFPLIIDQENMGELAPENAAEVDAAIEFTTPESAPGNVMKCLDLGIPVVSGTTGWNDRYEELDAYCRKMHGAFFRASNFSIGVNILFSLNRKLAETMSRFPQYRASLREVHHVHKLDAPSGTAISLAEQIIEKHAGISDWSLEEDKGPSVLSVTAIREGEVKGQHQVSYASDLDRISIAHEAMSRDAFAAGALMAAGFIAERKGVYSMEDLLQL